MNRSIIKPALFSILACFSVSVGADEVASAQKPEDKLEHGEKMHTEHCVKCHDDKVYTRENRLVRSLNALSKQVVRCKDNTGVAWFDEDTDAVVHFLNEKYYKF